MKKRMLSALVALVVCAGVLAALPMRARAAGADYGAYGAGGGGGGGGGAGLGTIGGTGGDGGANGKGDTGEDGKAHSSIDIYGGGAGGKGADGVLVGGAEIPPTGGAGGAEVTSNAPGANGGNALALDTAPAAGGYGAIAVKGGSGGNAGSAGNAGSGYSGGDGGNGGAVAVTFAPGNVTADSVTVLGGNAGASTNATAGAGGDAKLMVNGDLTANSLTVAGGAAGSKSGGEGSLITNGGNIILSGSASVGSGGALSSSAGFFVPEGAQSTLVLSGGGKFAAGYVRVLAGASLTISGDAASDFSAGWIDMYPGATLVANGVDLKGATINSHLDSQYYTYSKETGGGLALQVSHDPNTLRGVWLEDTLLTAGTDYTWDSTTRLLTLADALLQAQADGYHWLKVGMGPDGQAPLPARLAITSKPVLHLTVQGNAAVDVSFDGGANWAPYTQDMDIPASATSVLMGMRFQQPSVKINIDVVGGQLDGFQVMDRQLCAKLVPATGSSFSKPVYATLIVQPITTQHNDLALSWEADGSLMVRSNVEPDGYELLGWTVDVNSWLGEGTDYTDKTASPFAMQLHKSFLGTLAPGTHTVQLLLASGAEYSYAQGSFTWPQPAPTPAPTATAAPAAASTVAPSPQTGDIGTGPYIVFAVSGGLMLVWLGMQVFKRRGKDD